MLPWLLPVIFASIGVLLVVIALAIYFCRKHSDTLSWTHKAAETGQLMRQAQMLDRFILFQLNLFSILWNTEHDIVHTHREIVYTRRGVNILTLLLFFFAIDFADQIDANWCCYPTTVFDDLVYGTCSFPGAPIHNMTDLYRPCTTLMTWVWVSNAVFIFFLSASVVLHIYLSITFVHDVRHSMEGAYAGAVDMINSTVPGALGMNLKKHVWMTFINHMEKKKDEQFNVHSINLHRLAHLMLDPFAIFFGFPHIVLSRSDLSIANFLCLFTMATQFGALILWAQPAWAQTCCFYDTESSSGRFGSCSDPSSVIMHDPNRKDCAGTFSTSMTVLSCLIGIEFVCILIMWFYTFTLFHHNLRLQLEKIVTSLKENAHRREPGTLQKFLERNRPPPYTDRPPPFTVLG